MQICLVNVFLRFILRVAARCQARVPHRANPDIMPTYDDSADESHAPLILFVYRSVSRWARRPPACSARACRPIRRQSAASLGAFRPSLLRALHRYCGQGRVWWHPRSMGTRTIRTISWKPSAAAAPFSTTIMTAGWTFSCSAEPASKPRSGRHHQPALQEQPRRHVHRCNGKSRAARCRLGLRRLRRRLR